MAVTFSPQAQVMFFQCVCGADSPQLELALKLVQKGVVFKTGIYTVQAAYQGNHYQLGLVAGSTALMKHSVDAPKMQATKKMVTAWLNKLAAHLGEEEIFVPDGPDFPPVQPEATPELEQKADHGKPSQPYEVWLVSVGDSMYVSVIKVIRQYTGISLKEAKAMVDTVKESGPQIVCALSDASAAIKFKKALVDKEATARVLHQGFDLSAVDLAAPAKPVTPEVKGNAKPVCAVIPLRDANALGQRVHGTSGGSVYHCVAYNERVKVAARIYNAKKSISLRAEWVNPSDGEMQRIQQSGMAVKGEYASMHMGIGDVPPERVIGAFLLGLGIQWTDQVTHAGQLVLE